MTAEPARRLTAELLGSALLCGVVIGSGILAERMAGDNAALALLANTGATVAILYVLIAILGPISGAHFNPAVTLAKLLRREMKAAEAFAYATVQVGGCIMGAVLAHAMFGLPLIQSATQSRPDLWLSEGVATFALVLAIFGVGAMRPRSAPAVVALVIGAGYWWTPSTSFVNPAITAARSLSDTFAGVSAADVPSFVAAQFAGAVLATIISAWLFDRAPAR